MAKRGLKKSGQAKLNSDSKTLAFIAAFFGIIGFIIAIIAKRDDKYVMYYAKHSLVIFIIAVVAAVISGVLGWLPVIGWVISAALYLLVIITWVMNWAFSLTGERKQIPLITDFAEKFNF